MEVTMAQAASHLATESHTGKCNGLRGAPQDLGAIAAELARLRAEAEAEANKGNQGIEAENALWGRIGDLEDLLAQARPRDAREALIIAALASHMVREVDGVADPVHQRACSLVARLLDWIEAAAGVTAAEMGLRCYTADREGGPRYEEDDGAEVLQLGYEHGYLAAVRRFAPMFYQFAQAELHTREARTPARHRAGVQHDEVVGFGPRTAS
jgi:hypothetical protein